MSSRGRSCSRPSSSAAGPAHPRRARYGGLTIDVSQTDAFPGGVLNVRIARARPLRGTVLGNLDGRRCPAFWTRDGLRVLVPVPVTFPPGPTTLGVEIRSSRGRQRFAVPVTVGARAYPPRETMLPDAKREHGRDSGQRA